MSSTARWKEFIKGMLSAGEPTFRLRLGRAQYNTLQNALIDSSDTIPTWKFKMGLLSAESTASNWTFAAIITKLGPKEASIESEGAWEADVTIKVTGAVTFTAGS